jgi:probable phosphoglycerate mutase
MTIRLALIRHGPTAWNAEGRMQGRADIPLSDAGRAAVRAWQPHPSWLRARWYTSPLGRARETAALLGVAEATVDPRLTEMDWGTWEGQRLEDLRDVLGPRMQALEDRGLDFRPEDGESPRDVQARLRPWLAALAADPGPAVAVTHKGVIRALFAQAHGWDMLGPSPVTLGWDDVAHVFAVAADGAVTPVAMNRPLADGWPAS